MAGEKESLSGAIARFLSEEKDFPNTRAERLIQEAYEEAEENGRLFDFVRWLKEDTDGRAVPKQAYDKAKVDLAENLVKAFTK